MKNVELENFPKDEFISFSMLEEYLNQQERDENEIKNIIEKVMQENYIRYNALKRKKNWETGKKGENSKVIDETDEPSIEIEKSSNELVDVTFYLNQLQFCMDKEEVISYLPSRDNPDFILLINTILVYILKDCREIEEFLATEEMTEEDYQELKQEVERKREWIQEIILYRDHKEIENVEPVENKLLYLTSSSQNYYIWKDFEKIDIEYYHSFLGLIDSIINGTFKNVRVFTNNNKISGIYEVRDFKTRVLFAQINKNTFIILSIFMKKVDKNSIYLEQITNRARIFYEQKKEIKEQCKQEDYQKEQQEITILLQRKLKKEED